MHLSFYNPNYERYATLNWLGGVASTGTFYKNPDATWVKTITRSPSTVPSTWTITNAT